MTEGTSPLEALFEVFVQDWVATRFVNRAHLLYASHVHKAKAGADNEAAVVDDVAAMVAGAQACGSIRLQVTHHPNDPNDPKLTIYIYSLKNKESDLMRAPCVLY